MERQADRRSAWNCRSAGLRGDICVEKKLKQLFDFQKFEGNSDLQLIIDSVHARYGVKELSLDDMEFVAAAGDPNASKKKGQEKKEP